MKTILSGYFDVGFSIGIDDISFDPVKISKLNFPTNYVYLPNDEITSDLLNLKFGRGLQFDITNSSIFSDWKRGAIEISQSNEYIEDIKNSAIVLTEMNQLLSNLIHYKLFLVLYSCGIGIVELIFDEVSEQCLPESIMKFLQAFENAAYSRYNSETTFQIELQKNAQEILKSFLSDDDPIFQICSRPKEHNQQFIFNFFPGFTVLLISPNEKFCQTVYLYRKQQRKDDFEILPLGDSTVWVSWYILIHKTDYSKDESTLLQIIRIYSLFYGLCQFYSNFLYDKISELFRCNNKSASDSSETLSRLQTLGHIFVNYSDINNVTINIEIQHILDCIDIPGRINQWHQGMIKSIEVLSSMQKEIDSQIENKIHQDEKIRDEKINKFIAIITSFTFVSVIVDLFNLDKYSSNFIPQPYLRLILYAFLFLAILVFWQILFGRNTGSSKGIFDKSFLRRIRNH